MKLHVFAKKSQADFAANNCNRKIFLLQATFTRDVVAIFPKTIGIPQYMSADLTKGSFGHFSSFYVIKTSKTSKISIFCMFKESKWF